MASLTFIKYCGEAWSDIAHGNHLSFSLGNFVSTLLISCHHLLLGLFSSFGIIQLIPIALPTCFAIGNSGASEMIIWWVIFARIGHLSILLYHLGVMFDCHKLAIELYGSFIHVERPTNRQVLDVLKIVWLCTG
jgi:hypothetical protein